MRALRKAERARARGTIGARALRHAVVATVAALALPGAASATVTAPEVLAGPDAAITELGGVSMSGDGTGGLVYRKVDAAGSHIFAARYANGRWTIPQRIDTALPYDSLEPRIAAGDNGRLVAVWVQDFGHKGLVPQYRLQAATVAPGGRNFEAPITVAPNVSGRGGLSAAEGAAPQLAMNDLGVAYLAYRVTVAGAATTGQISANYRVARFVGGTWSNVGTVNRRPSIPVAAATDGNGPQVTVDLNGNGLVAFQEPDDAGVQRIYGRRLFATRLGLIQQLSPSTIGDLPLRGDADAFALGGGGLGSGSVVFRQQPGLNSPLAGPRMLISRISAPPNPTAPQFQPAELVTDDGTALSLPAIGGNDHEDIAVAYATGDAVRSGTVAKPVSGALPLLAAGGATAPPLVAAGNEGAVVTAWPVLTDGRAGVAVQQRLPGGTVLPAQLAGVRGGAITDLRLAGSGLGDAIVAFLQGEGPDTQLVVATVRSPPQPFVVTAPDDWTRPSSIRLTWTRPDSAVGPIRYSVLIDGQVAGSDLVVPIARLPTGSVDDGEHDVVVRATDAKGEVTDSDAATMLVDGHAPTVTGRIDRARRLTLKLTDDVQGKGSGADVPATRITFGDGTTGKGRRALRHTYRRAGSYRVTVHVADDAGNRRTVRLKVTA